MKNQATCRVTVDISLRFGSHFKPGDSDKNTKYQCMKRLVVQKINSFLIKMEGATCFLKVLLLKEELFVSRCYLFLEGLAVKGRAVCLKVLLVS